MSSQSIKPNQLKRHFSTNNPEVAGKDPSYFERKAADLKRMHFDSEGKLSQENINRRRASYTVSLRIAKSGKPRTIAVKILLVVCSEKSCIEIKRYFYFKRHSTSKDS